MRELLTPAPPGAARGDDPIAVIGIGCRYPGGGDLDAFWRLLRDGRDAISEVPRERWDASAYYHPNLAAPGTMNTRWGGFLPDLEQFDASFFGVSAGEATAMDPQHRLLLEVSWEALEDAGQSPARLAGSRTGVFVGMIGDDSDRVAGTRGEPPNAYYAAGHVHCLAPNRISRFLDLRGPSLVVDSGCSASLYAIHLACQSLRSGESTLALAGGVNVILAPAQTVAASQAWMTSVSGRCKSFDVDADGYVRSEGCGLVVLKPLERALADGDRIWGVIRKSGVNQDGRMKTVTSPNARAIAELIHGVLREARVTPAEIDYVEAHGVGTPATDAAEAAALRDVLGAPPQRERPCLVGSLKPNIGHPEPAAGVASLIKVLLCLAHETIAPHIHLERLRPELDLPGVVEIPSTPRPWPRAPGRLRRAGVNSFGIGGANAHLLVEEAPAPLREEAPVWPAHVFTLSARTAAALRALAARHAEHLAAHPDDGLADVCFTANTGRTHFAHRLAIVCESTADLRAQLEAFVAGASAPAMHPGAAALERARAAARDGAAAGLPSLTAGDRRSLLEALATLYLEQVPVDWEGFEGSGRRRLGLPTYPFQRRRFWPREGGADAPGPAPSTTGASKPAVHAQGDDIAWVMALRAAPPSARRGAMLEMVEGEVARLVGVPSVEPRGPFVDLGLTSLMAVELRNALATRTGVPLSATLAFDHPHPEAIADFLLGQVFPPTSEPATLPVARAGAAAADEPIAIVGIGCRFPGGVTDPESFWRLLQEGGDAIVEVPRDRWDLREWYDPNPDAPGMMTTRWGGFLGDIDRFEPEFFGISPREAPAIDPQQRLLLEVSHAALEDAGLPLERLNGSDTGVFMGICGTDYEFRALADAAAIDAYTVLGSAHSTIVGRLSYWLGLKGPSLAIDTACSSSLVAVHLACQALRAGECSLALAGGVSVILSPNMSVYFSKMGGVSPTGRCRPFSHDADGFVRSEGCGVVVLKTLSDARRDGDAILAVLRGTAVNQDGRSNGLMAPNGPAQEAVIRRALEQARVAPDAVGYVECHGTGTSLGDPIEINALGAALGAGRPPDRPALVGSVKSNLGHTEGAAGVAGLIKVVLCLEHEKIAKTVHFTQGNPLIPWDALPLKVAAETQDWRRSGTPRIAGVSAFGFGGTNAHAVVEEAPEELEPTREGPAAGDGADLLVLSARTEGSLRALAARWATHVERHPHPRLSDLCRSAATGRSHFDRRAALVASGHDAMREALDSLARGAPDARVATGEARGTPKVAFVFSGQGAQRPGMGEELAARYPVFREALDACASGFDRALARPLLSVMWAPPGSEAAALLDEASFAQPALFALQYALCQLWRSFGVEPDVLLGHSFGEIAAACAAGVFSLPDALRLVAARGRLTQALPRGGVMLLVETPEAAAAAAVAPHAAAVSIAAVNSPTQVVLSGVEAVVLALGAAFEAKGVHTKRLTVSYAGHSPLVVPALDELRKVAETIEYQRPRPPIVNNMSGAPGGDELATPAYWVNNLRETARFADGVRALGAAGVRTIVELSPGATLLALVAACLPDAQPTLLASLRLGRREPETMLEAFARCYVADPRIGSSAEHRAWGGVFPHPRASGPRVTLPTYPFQRTRHWIDAAEDDRGERRRGGHPLLGPAIALSTPGGARLHEIHLGLTRLPWLADHRVDGGAIFPGAGYVEMALAAGAEVFGEAALEVRDLVLSQALPVPAGGAVPVQLVASDLRLGAMRVQVASQPSGAPSWTVHARAEVHRLEGVEVPARLDLPALRMRLGASQEAARVYAELARLGLAYGPAFQGVVSLWKGEREALGQVALPASGTTPFRFHPALLDACFQVAADLLSVEEAAPWVPVEIASLRFHRRPTGELWCHARVGAVPEGTTRRVACDLLVTDDAGSPIVEVRGLVAQRLATSARRRDPEAFLALDWERAELPPRRLARGRWLLLGDAGGLGAALREALDAAGHTVAQAAGEGAGVGGLRALLADAFGGAPPTGVVHLPGEPPPGEPGEADLLRGCERVLETVQALAGMGYRDAPRLWIVTRGAQAVASGAVALAEAPLVGLGRVVALEHPELRCVRVDLDPRRPHGEHETLLTELLADDVEDEIALRGDERRVARLVRAGLDAWTEPAAGRAFALGMDAPGVLDRLVLRATPRRPPGPGEVEIAVDAAGLNFLDVLLALGVMPDELAGGEGLRLGSECAGRVLRAGVGVLDLAPGDEVLALAGGAVASHVTTSSTLVVRRPSILSPREAASVPIAYLTALYALEKVARLRRGERVLIHAATGGVGTAALEWAAHVGAEVFATAGTPEKRAMLRERGVHHVSDSRTDQFVADVRAWTHGEGVDVVLNSLSGDLLEKSFDLLRPHGRFVEIGKRDYYANASLGMKPFLRSLSLSLVDLRAMILRRPDEVRELLAEVLRLFEQRVFTPPTVEGFSIARAVDAFRKMAQARHTGKLAITFDTQEVAVRVEPGDAPPLRADGSYLVTGGLGGLGGAVGAWLAENGAGHVVLIGRTGASTAARAAAIDALRARAPRSKVTVAAVDVADRGALSALLSSLPHDLPLRGVVHAAGVLDDSMLASETPAHFRRVMAPKAAGALNLHELTRTQPLDFFVLYGSIAALLGSPGQGSYAAANAFLDALAHHRRGLGLPAVSIDWGAFSGVGMVAEGGRGERLAGRGLRSMTAEQGIAALARVLEGSPPQIGVAPFDARQWLEFYPLAACSPRLAQLAVVEPDDRAADPGVRELLSSADPAERQRLVEGFLRREASQVLRIPPEQIDAEAPLSSMGMDSLMGLELRNRIEATLGAKLPAAALWTYPTLSALSRHLSPPEPAALDETRRGSVAVAAKEALLVEEVASMPTDDLLSFVDDLLQRSNKDRG